MNTLRLACNVALILLTLTATSAAAHLSGAGVTGVVSLPAAEGQSAAVPGVTVALVCGAAEPRIDVSDADGRFRFEDVPVGTCSVTATLDGFKPVGKTIAIKENATTDVAITLEIEVLHQEVQVTGTTDGMASNPIASKVETVTSETIKRAPVVSSRFQDALPLIPGVVRGPDGQISVGGSRSSQMAIMLSNTLSTDPITGEDAVQLPLDAVDEVQVHRAAFAPEFGLSNGAVTTVQMKHGGDAWSFAVNDLEPRARFRDGTLRGIESWTPRISVGGPIVKGKLSMFEALEYGYSQTPVFSLPPLARDTKDESLESYTRFDWKATPIDHLSASLVAAPRRTTYAGLNTFNPQPVTPNFERRDYFVTLTHQRIVRQSGLLDSWIGLKRFGRTVDPRQGAGPMVLAPDVNSGSYFNSQDVTSRRAEFVSNYTFTPFGPVHVLKVGAGGAWEGMTGVMTGREVDIERADRTLSQRYTYVGNGRLSRDRAGVGGFLQDSWTIISRVTAQFGFRWEYDTLLSDAHPQPRASLTAKLTEDGRTVVRGGVGVFYSLAPLNVGTFDGLQRRTVTLFAHDGVTPLGDTELVRNVDGRTRTPRSLNWNTEIDRQVIRNLTVRVGYQQRSTRSEPIVDATPLGSADPALQLHGDGRSRYRETQVLARYQFHGSDQLVGSYTHSSAIGDLNEFNAFFGYLQNPVIRANERGPLPFDSPNRFLWWSNVSLPKGFAVFPVLDLRTGFPVSMVDQDRNFVGPRNRAGRYPEFVSLDMQLTKRLKVMHHTTTLGVKVFNITNHFNPRDYQDNLASTAFGTFYNGVGRTFRGKWEIDF
jgi:hypothetical protein